MTSFQHPIEKVARSVKTMLKKAFDAFLGLSTPKKVTIGAAVTAASAAAIAEIFFAPYRTPGLPDAPNLDGFAPTMNRKEAIAILGVSDNSAKEIQKHHRNMMALHHPDKGGSSYIATKINEARDFLALGSKE